MGELSLGLSGSKRTKTWALVNAVINSRVPKMLVMSSPVEEITDSKEGLYFVQLVGPLVSYVEI
jgi:hypothetical protein